MRAISASIAAGSVQRCSAIWLQRGKAQVPSEVVDVGRSRGEGLDAGAADGARASIALATRLRFAAGSVAR